MATVKASLTGGLQVGETVHKEAELRELTAGDLIDSQRASEQLMLAPQPDGSMAPELISSPVTAGLEALARRIIRIGGLEGPFEIEDLKMMKKAEDLAILQDAAERLDAAAIKPITDLLSKQGRS